MILRGSSKLCPEVRIVLVLHYKEYIYFKTKNVLHRDASTIHFCDTGYYNRRIKRIEYN